MDFSNGQTVVIFESHKNAHKRSSIAEEALHQMDKMTCSINVTLPFSRHNSACSRSSSTAWPCYRDEDYAWIQQHQLPLNKSDLAKPPVSLTYLQLRT